MQTQVRGTVLSLGFDVRGNVRRRERMVDKKNAWKIIMKLHMEGEEDCGEQNLKCGKSEDSERRDGRRERIKGKGEYGFVGNVILGS